MPTINMADTEISDKYKDMEAEEILATLTAEELEQISNEMDPDDALLPPSERSKYKVEKEPTGPFNREALMEFLEKKAKEDPDWEEHVPFKQGQKRGKVYDTKKEEEPEKKKAEENGQKVDIGEEWESALEDASEEDLVQLAGILGIHSMLNNDQLNAALAEETLDSDRMTFKGPAKSSPLKKIGTQEPPNDTDVEKSLEQLQKNDSSLTELNLNNIKNMSLETVKNLLEAVQSNSQLTSLSMASTRIGDESATHIAEMLKKNSTLKSLNVESNFITGEGIRKIMLAMKDNSTLLELRMANQRMMLGVQVETEVADILVKHNKTIVKFGLVFQHAGPRRKAHDAVLRNYELVRKQRTKKE